MKTAFNKSKVIKSIGKHSSHLESNLCCRHNEHIKRPGTSSDNKINRKITKHGIPIPSFQRFCSVVIVSGFQPHDRQYLSSLMLSTMMQGNFEHWLIETASYQTKMVKRILECLVIIVIQPGDTNSKVKFMEFLKHSENKLLSNERYNMKLYQKYL